MLHLSKIKAFADYKLTLLPHNKILDLSNLKAFADNNLDMTQIMEFVINWEENILGKEENAGYQHFLLFPKCFQNAFILRVVKAWDHMVKS